MLSSSRFFYSSLMVLAVGVSLFLSRSNSDFPTKTKTTEGYWLDTGLNSNTLKDLLEESTCLSSERYFLACTNAILAVAGRYNLTISPQGQLTPIHDRLSVDMSSERMQMLPWQKFFQESFAKAQQISFFQLWSELQQKYIPKNQEALMVGAALNGFISVFRDPHTYFMPVSMFREVISRADNRSTSLGILLGRNESHYVIRKVIDGSAADRAGLKKGDLILAVNGYSVVGLLQSRVGELLKGDLGTRTRLTISRDGRSEDKTLTRVEITVATVAVRVIDGPKPIGVLTINKFAKNACTKTREALDMVNRAGVQGLLLDLRDNPGGQMEEAACIASLFVGAEKKIFEIRYLDPTKPNEVFTGNEQQVFDKPLAVLINGSSASASEIVAGALRDLNRAILVGERSFGKGSFQEGELWSQNNKIALFETKGFYYLPSGRSPQMTGLEPDVKVAFGDIQVGREEDLFMSPLHAPEKAVRSRKAIFLNCDDSRDLFSDEDRQLSRAREILFCTKAVAGVQ